MGNDYLISSDFLALSLSLPFYLTVGSLRSPPPPRRSITCMRTLGSRLNRRQGYAKFLPRLLLAFKLSLLRLHLSFVTD